MRVKKLEFERFTATFDDALRGYMAAHPAALFYTDRELPTLQKCKGEIVLLDDFQSTTNIGIPWGQFTIKDTRCIPQRCKSGC